MKFNLYTVGFSHAYQGWINLNNTLEKNNGFCFK